VRADVKRLGPTEVSVHAVEDHDEATAGDGLPVEVAKYSVARVSCPSTLSELDEIVRDGRLQREDANVPLLLGERDGLLHWVKVIEAEVQAPFAAGGGVAEEGEEPPVQLLVIARRGDHVPNLFKLGASQRTSKDR
jgi:hypothetical protein